MKNFLKKYYPVGIFWLVAMAIMGPLYGRGYVFLIDMVWGPRINLAEMLRDGFGPMSLLNALLFSLSLLFSWEILQKIVLTFILFLPGLAMFQLASRYMRRSLAIASGLLFLLNPSVCERFFVGHWVVLLGYGFFPIMVLLLIEFFEKQTWRRFFLLALAFAVYPLLSLHWAYIATGFLLVYGGVVVFQKKAWAKLFSFAALQKFFLLAAIFLLVNIFWLFGFFDRTKSFSNISLSDFRAFSTLPDPHFGVFFNVLSLYGIWSSNFLLPKDFFSGWWVVTIVVLIFAIVGAWSQIRKRNLLAWAIAASFGPALLLSVGYGNAFTQAITDFLFATLPFFRGLRDTEKISGVLAFAYAFLVPIGISVVSSFVEKSSRFGKIAKQWFSFEALAFVVPLFWAGTLLWGGFGQFAPHGYPQGWQEAQNALQTDKQVRNVLFLPWHMYIRLNFAGNVMAASPAGVFFSERMLTGKDTDNRFLLEAEKSPLDEHVSLLARETIPDDREFWKSENVSHIVIAKTDDWEKFSKLSASDFFEKIVDNDSILVFRVKY